MKRSRITRHTHIKQSNPARKKATFARAYGSAERCVFVKSLPCCVAGDLCAGETTNAHVRGDGASRKADADQIAPLCSYHHAELHAIGIATFTMRYAVDLDAEARRTEELWLSQNRQSELTPIGDVVSSVWPASDAGAA
jgi:hypothetical protein